MENNEMELQRELDQLNEDIARETKRRVMPDAKLMLERGTRILVIERKLSEIRNLEYAEEIDIDLIVGFDWYCVSSFREDTYLVCDLLGDRKDKYKSVIFRFTHSVETRFGGLNDEVLDQHPLYGRGLDICGFFVVKNSEWKSSLQNKMKTHICYNEKFWSKVEHYLFRDKGGEMACLATGTEYWLSTDSVDDFRKRIFLNRGIGIEHIECQSGKKILPVGT